jgi:hypothetical protein
MDVEILFWERPKKDCSHSLTKHLGLGAPKKNYFRKGMLKGYFGACPLFALMAFTMGNTNAMMAMAMIPSKPNPRSSTRGTQRII